MAVNLIPGYDFSINELVTATKLAAWIAGVRNEGTITLADLGLNVAAINVVATRSTAATQGMLYLDTTHGMLCVHTAWGQVPFALTRGALFSRRIPLDDGDYATARNWFSLNCSLYRDLGVPGAPGFAMSSYSAGEHLAGLGASLSALCIDTYSSGNYLRGGSLWPSEDFSTGVASFNSSATMFGFLSAWGGWLPLVATCASSAYTAPSLSNATGNLCIQGAANYVTAADTNIKFGVDARNGQRAGNPAVHQMAFVYPHWDYNASTANFSQNRFY